MIQSGMTNTTLLPFEDFENLTPGDMYMYLVEAHDKLQHAAYQVAQLRHQLYGRKSEKLKELQHPTLPGFEQQVFDEKQGVNEEEDPEEPAVQDKHQKKTGRKPLPGHLPRERVIHDLPKVDQQCDCGHPLHKIGEETSEQLDYIPAQVKVIQHVRYKYACKVCENTVKTAPAPAQPIPKSIATANLLAHVFVSKFDDHLPLYRQAEIWQRLGVDLNRATLSNWVVKAGALCAPLIALLKTHMIQSQYVQADETTAVLLKKTKERTKSYMWVYKTGYGKNQALVYEFQESREGKHPTAFLSGFNGYLQGDAYSGYNAVSSRKDITRVGCMAHARRKFVEVINMAPNKQGFAHQVVKKIQEIYRVEEKIKQEVMPPDKVRDYRKKHAEPLLNDLKTGLDDIKPKTPPKGPLGKAIAYAVGHWAELTRYLEDGKLEIDNNACERAIRPFTVGRKNWLFMGNMAGAQGSAALYSLIETAKANGIDAYKYLCYVLDMIPKLKPEQLSQLLPWNCPDFLQSTYVPAN